MYKILFLLILRFQSYQLFSQNSKVDISFALCNKEIRDSADLDVCVRYNNVTKDSVYVYNLLEYGGLYMSYANVNIQIDRLEKGVYKKAVLVSSCAFLLENEDSYFSQG